MRKNINTLLIFLFTILLISCNEEKLVNEVNFVAFEGNSVSRDFGVVIEGETTKNVKIIATKASSSNRTFNILVDSDKTTVDPAAYTVSSSVTIPANSKYGEFAITISDLNIEDGQELVLNLESPDNTIVGESLEFNVSQLCQLNQVVLNLAFDTYPEEVYWRIKDSNGTTLFESQTPAGFGAYNGFSGSITEKFCMDSGDYTFEIFDGYEDGAGAFSLSIDGVTLFSSDGAYGAGTSGAFTLP